MLEGDGKNVGVDAHALTADITGIACDSRRVEPGFLFAALPGTAADGRAFITDAIAKGASAILAPHGTTPDDLPEPAMPLITDQNPRHRYALMASTFYARQPASVAAITGTNGKTSVATFTRQIWSALGMRAASTGTLGTRATGGGLDLNLGGSLTTPDPADLHRTLAELAGYGIEHLAMEASSHGLDQYRIDGVDVAIAAFTNLSRDHLDYHGDEATYYAAKRRLFSDLLRSDGVAVLNADCTQFDELAAVVRKRGATMIDYGRAATDIRLDEALPVGDGQGLRLCVNGRDVERHLPLIGSFQTANVLCALGIVLASGADLMSALDALETLRGVRGRLQHAGKLPNGASVYVDYAHTPDALVNVLQAVRPHASGRVSVVFGCGGDRDSGKRVEMGRAAAGHADQVFVSDDNPRSEDASAIRAQAMTGCPDALEIGDRAEAIQRAVAALEAGDLLVVAGKGHEQGQIVRGEVLPFDDVDVVQRAIADAEASS